MRVWIFQLVVIWVWMVVVHDHHVLANNDESTNYAHPESTIRMYASNDHESTKINCPALSLFIVGIHNLCIEANKNVPRLAECNNTEIKQKWLLYDDGTIRTAKDDSLCLVTNDLTPASNILILYCVTVSSDYQRWEFNTSANTIGNPSSNLNLDVTGLNNAPGSPMQFILWPFHEGINERWYIKPSV